MAPPVRERPPEELGRPPVGITACRHGNADLRSAQPAAGGRSRVSPITGMVPVSALSSSREVTRPQGTLPARRSAWWLGRRDLHHPGNCTFMTGGVCRRTRSCGSLPVGPGTAARSAAGGSSLIPIDGTQARERRPLASSPGGGRHRRAKRSERRVPGRRSDDAEGRGSGREANPLRTRGPSRPPACGGLCRPEVGVPLPARHSAWWRGADTCTIHHRPLRSPSSWNSQDHSTMHRVLVRLPDDPGGAQVPSTAQSRWCGVPSASSTRSSSTPVKPRAASHSCTCGLPAWIGAVSPASRWNRVWW